MATITVVEQCKIRPSPGAPTEQLLPLLYSDLVFITHPLPQHLFFYTHQFSESYFSNTILPNLKNSLSLTLQHFTPFAGNIIFPLASTSSSAMPVSHYVDGDSISLTIALSSADLNHLTANLPRDADQFFDLAARFPPPTYSPEFVKFSVAAIQLTLFPNQGICIGITHHHAIADASTILRFTKAWASITKFNGALGRDCLPFYDRSGVQDSETLTPKCWSHAGMLKPTVSSTNHAPTNKVRATFVMSKPQIQKLANFILNKKPSLAGVSSFAVVCAHVWTSLARSAAAAGEEVADDKPEYFNCAADMRARLNPPLPVNYFGNCLAPVVARSTHGRIKGGEGIVVAAEAIWDAIGKTVNNDSGVPNPDCFLELERLKRMGNRILGITGSSRSDVYVMDFGWGRPKKYELAQIAFTGSVSIFASREFGGGVEIGLSMPKVKMESFSAIFNQGIREATENAYKDLSKL